MIRIQRLLATVATSAILLLGAVIALEALGLLFVKESAEPAVANVHFREVPEETAPAQLMKQLEEQERAEAKVRQERARQEQANEAQASEEEQRRQAAADAEAARRLAEAEEREVEKAEQSAPTGKAAQRVAALGPPPVTDAPPSRPEVQQPPPQEGASTVKLAPAAGPEQGKRTVHLTSARRERARRLHRSARAGSRCPFLAWWETVVLGPPAPQRRPA
jgi:hypothetical protein